MLNWKWLPFIAFALFVWVTGAFVLHSASNSRESERLHEHLKLTQSLVLDRIHLLQVEVGRLLESGEVQDKRFELVALVGKEERGLVLEKVFRAESATALSRDYLSSELRSRGNVEAAAKAFLWVDRGPDQAEYFFSLLPFELEGGKASWGLSVSRLPSPWIQFSGSKSLFLLDQRSEKILSAYGGINQGDDLTSDFKEVSFSDVASVKLTSKEALAWQDVPGTNLTLVLREARPSFWSGLVIWGATSLLFLLGLLLFLFEKKAKEREVAVATTASAPADLMELREEEELKEEMTLEEMVPVKSEILHVVDSLGPPPKRSPIPIESVVEEQLLESVVIKKSVQGNRLINGIEDALESMTAEIQASGVRVNLMVPEDLVSDWPQTQLRTVLEEVVRNSLEAMESSETKTLTFYGNDLGTSVELVVEDTGTGMTDEVLGRALEAFFSTKPSLNKRRGLGLNVAKRLLEISGGKLKIDSTPAVGTKVSLTFLKENRDHPELKG